MKNWKASLVEFLTAVALALFILVLCPSAHAAGDLPPKDSATIGPPVERVRIPVRCSEGLCVLPEVLFQAIHGTNLQLLKENEDLRTQLDHAADGKKCAVLKVEPPRNGGRS